VRADDRSRRAGGRFRPGTRNSGGLINRHPGSQRANFFKSIVLTLTVPLWGAAPFRANIYPASVSRCRVLSEREYRLFGGPAAE